MTVFQCIAALLTAAALAGYVNQRFFRWPTTIALMGFALLISMIGVSLNRLGLLDLHDASVFVSSIDFSDMLLNGFLSMLLFAGAMHLDLTELHRVRSSVFALATFGVVISSFVTGALLWIVMAACGFKMHLIHALLFGALISPTDPVAVLAILRKVQVSKRLYAAVGGENLLNDGVGIVVFLAFLGLATNTQRFDLVAMTSNLVWMVLGGAGLGIAMGLVTSYLLHTIDDYKVEILLTLALASGGYVLAGLIYTSGPIAAAVAGLVIGSQGRLRGAEAVTRKHLFMFWELMDEILNAVLFLVMGLELIIITITPQHFVMGLLAVPVLLIARLLSVGLPISIIRVFRGGRKRYGATFNLGRLTRWYFYRLGSGAAEYAQRRTCCCR